MDDISRIVNLFSQIKSILDGPLSKAKEEIIKCRRELLETLVRDYFPSEEFVDNYLGGYKEELSPKKVIYLDIRFKKGEYTYGDYGNAPMIINVTKTEVEFYHMFNSISKKYGESRLPFPLEEYRRGYKKEMRARDLECWGHGFKLCDDFRDDFRYAHTRLYKQAVYGRKIEIEEIVKNDHVFDLFIKAFCDKLDGRLGLLKEYEKEKREIYQVNKGAIDSFRQNLETFRDKYITHH